jgi:hypothetical protein
MLLFSTLPHTNFSLSLSLSLFSTLSPMLPHVLQDKAARSPAHKLLTLDETLYLL